MDVSYMLLINGLSWLAANISEDFNLINTISLREKKKIKRGSIVYSSSSVRIYTPNRGNVDAGAVVNVYRYYTKLSTYGLSRISGTSITFQLKSCRDAAVLLSTAEDLVSPNFYEFFLGGAGNKMIFLTKMDGSNDANARSPNLLDCKQMTSLWLSWENGRIKAGTGSLVDQNVLLDWTDARPFDIKGIGIMSAWGSSGEWIFTVEGSPDSTFFCGTVGNKASSFIETKNGATELQCAVMCISSDSCLGFNYKGQTQMCEFVSSNEFQQTVTDADWIMFSRCWTN